MKMIINNNEVDAILTALRAQSRDATKGLYAEKEWARSVEVLIFILTDWQKMQHPLIVNASDLDGPVWSVQQQTMGIIEHAVCK